MIADTAQALLIAAVFAAIIAGNLWNARRIHHKHEREAGEFR